MPDATGIGEVDGLSAGNSRIRRSKMRLKRPVFPLDSTRGRGLGCAVLKAQSGQKLYDAAKNGVVSDRLSCTWALDLGTGRATASALSARRTTANLLWPGRSYGDWTAFQPSKARASPTHFLAERFIASPEWYSSSRYRKIRNLLARDLLVVEQQDSHLPGGAMPGPRAGDARKPQGSRAVAEERKAGADHRHS